MAARSKALFIAGGGYGKGVLSLIRSFAISTKKEVHTSAYDKNIDEAIAQPTTVPDKVIEIESEPFWGPHPRTGVFGPVRPDTEPSLTSGAQLTENDSSVLDQKVRYRPLEDIEKPVHP